MERCYLLRDGGETSRGERGRKRICALIIRRTIAVRTLLALLTGIRGRSYQRNARRPSQSTVDDLHVHVTEFRWGR